MLCACGCNIEIKERPWHKYKPVRFISSHNMKPKNPVSLIDNNRDKRKNQTGFIALKTVQAIKHDALKAGYKWELSDLDVYNIIIKKCTYCGFEPSWPKNRTGIDRVDSKIGYIIDNCVPCCKKCNRAKSNESLNDFISWVKKTYLEMNKNGLIK